MKIKIKIQIYCTIQYQWWFAKCNMCKYWSWKLCMKLTLTKSLIRLWFRSRSSWFIERSVDWSPAISHFGVWVCDEKSRDNCSYLQFKHPTCEAFLQDVQLILQLLQEAINCLRRSLSWAVNNMYWIWDAERREVQHAVCDRTYPVVLEVAPVAVWWTTAHFAARPKQPSALRAERRCLPEPPHLHRMWRLWTSAPGH